MNPFFQDHYNELVDSPNQSEIWWHSVPLPDGNRINGYQADKDLQFKMWQAMQIDNDSGLAGKRVLDIGANDGFFSLAALKAGADMFLSKPVMPDALVKHIQTLLLEGAPEASLAGT